MIVRRVRRTYRGPQREKIGPKNDSGAPLPLAYTPLVKYRACISGLPSSSCLVAVFQEGEGGEEGGEMRHAEGAAGDGGEEGAPYGDGMQSVGSRSVISEARWYRSFGYNPDIQS